VVVATQEIRDSICLFESGRLRLSVEKNDAFQMREAWKEAQRKRCMGQVEQGNRGLEVASMLGIQV
jgi:hypothetical protein